MDTARSVQEIRKFKTHFKKIVLNGRFFRRNLRRPSFSQAFGNVDGTTFFQSEINGDHLLGTPIVPWINIFRHKALRQPTLTSSQRHLFKSHLPDLWQHLCPFHMSPPSVTNPYSLASDRPLNNYGNNSFIMI